MKTLRILTLTVAALAIGFSAARWCSAQPSKEPTGYDFGALQQLESFLTYLQETKQTNTLHRFETYGNATMASRLYADLGVTLAVLQRLRDGQTNSAYELLEGRLDSDLIGFVSSYRELPTTLQSQGSLKVIGYMKEYRAKFPFKHRYQEVDQGVADAFKILDEK